MVLAVIERGNDDGIARIVVASEHVTAFASLSAVWLHSGTMGPGVSNSILDDSELIDARLMQKRERRVLISDHVLNCCNSILR